MNWIQASENDIKTLILRHLISNSWNKRDIRLT